MYFYRKTFGSTQGAPPRLGSGNSVSDAAGDPKSVTKVAIEELRELEKQGEIKIYTPDQVSDLLTNHGAGKAKKQADAIRRAMVRNEELLIEGEIPASLQSGLK